MNQFRIRIAVCLRRTHAPKPDHSSASVSISSAEVELERIPNVSVVPLMRCIRFGCARSSPAVSLRKG